MIGEWLRVTRLRRTMFLIVMLLLASTLGWLGWRLLVQDEQLANQRLADDRDIAADLLRAALERRLSAVERDLDRHLDGTVGPSAVPQQDGATVVRLRPDAIQTWPERRLLYYPELRGQPEASAALFAAADDLEFGKGDSHAAIRALAAYAESTDPRVKAGALVRIARNHLKNGQPAEAVRTYDELGRLGAIPVGGMPAALAADLGRLGVFEQQKAVAALATTARALSEDLRSGTWPVSSATYEYLDREAGRWLTGRDRQSSRRLILSEATTWLWDRWTAHDLAPGRGRASIILPAGPALVVWRVSEDEVVAFAADSEHIERMWLAELQPLFAARRATFALLTPDGQRVSGDSSADRPAIRLASSTGLPWTIQVSSVAGANGAATERRTLLAVGMAVLFLLILVGAWFIDQTVARELAVADLRSNFVSAVSHEFRTPLTTLCQLSELLMRDRVASEDDRKQYYELLHAESQRLRRLVEALLNFGRLQAGRMQFRFAAVDLPAFVRQSVDEFSATQQARGRHIELHATADRARVSADCELLRSTFWNLLENAVKYSPDCHTVWVDVSAKNAHVEIAVRDHGVGIPRDEQRRVFDTFVRGRAARASDVRGTGVGLAMARQIARAHRGDITVKSEPGQGSTFTIVLPVMEREDSGEP